tara:strand:+ start:267 stop:473 length:207 start_codon:yes stop_codon:yes gene_type:complete
MEKETIIINKITNLVSGFTGFIIAVMLTTMVDSYKQHKLIETYDLILENVVEEVYKHEGLYEYYKKHE